MKPQPLEPKTLAGIRHVARNWPGDTLADEVVNDVHAAYLAGKVQAAYLLREAKLRAIDRYRAEQAGKLREARAAEGRVKVIGRTTTEADEHADQEIGERVHDVVDWTPRSPRLAGRPATRRRWP